MNNEPNRPTPSGPARRQFADVVRPGATPASPTSRPVIARPQMKDPSVAFSGVGVAAKLAQTRQTVPPTPSVAPQSVNSVPVNRPAAPTSPPQSVAPSSPKPFMPNRQPSEPAQPQPSTTPQPLVDTSNLFAPDPQPFQQKGKHSVLSEVLAVLAIVFLLVVIVDILLDAEVLDLPIPHTNFFEY